MKFYGALGGIGLGGLLGFAAVYTLVAGAACGALACDGLAGLAASLLGLAGGALGLGLGLAGVLALARRSRPG